jgi:hypothetical protein
MEKVRTFSAIVNQISLRKFCLCGRGKEKVLTIDKLTSFITQETSFQDE